MNISMHEIKEKFINGVQFEGNTTLAGWHTRPEEDKSFVEPPIIVKNDPALLNSKIWLVSAPGAVGKSTFAKHLSILTNSIYIDLSAAQAIGGYYITGGLSANSISKQWEDGRIALLIDALDEAALRVTFESKIDFFKDIIELSRNSKYPIVIFGRTVAIGESLLILEDAGVTPALITIDYFNKEKAKELVFKLTKKYLEKDSDIAAFKKHEISVLSCIEKILEALAETAIASDRSFSGYAPVLDAIAVFLSQQKNFSSIWNAADSLLDAHILEKICRLILEREQAKLKGQLTFLDETAKLPLYSIREQMICLNHMYSGKTAKQIVFRQHGLNGESFRKYTDAARSLLEQHPFLKDTKTPTNEVFAGAIQSFAVKNDIADDFSYFKRHSVSPLFSELYFNDKYIYESEAVEEEKKQYSQQYVKPEHVAPIFLSYEARAEQGKSVYLSVESDEDNPKAEVTINIYDNECLRECTMKSFEISSSGTIIFDKRAIAATINAPQMNILFRSMDTFYMFSPIEIEAHKIIFRCPEIHAASGNDRSNTISLCAKTVESEVCDIKLFGRTEVYVQWDKSNEYPWSKATPVSPSLLSFSLPMQTALHSFCKLVRAFRSHSKGCLARFEDKINHARMSKNFGKEIKEYLMKNNVITYSREDCMFYLDADNLGEITGMTYDDVVKKQCSTKLIKILASITE